MIDAMSARPDRRIKRVGRNCCCDRYRILAPGRKAAGREPLHRAAQRRLLTVAGARTASWWFDRHNGQNPEAFFDSRSTN